MDCLLAAVTRKRHVPDECSGTNVAAVMYGLALHDEGNDDEGCSCLCLCVRTVTNSRLTYVSKLAFENNLKLQYL